MERFVIEDATEADLDAVMGIEGECFPTPWPREAFEQELGMPFSGMLVARAADDRPGPVVGYVVFWVVETEVHILTLAVDPRARGQGLGRTLLERAEAAGVDRGGRHAYLEVRKGNRTAIRLYRNSGYGQIGIRRRYYSDNDEDAIVMAKVLVGDPDSLPA